PTPCPGRIGRLRRPSSTSSMARGLEMRHMREHHLDASSVPRLAVLVAAGIGGIVALVLLIIFIGGWKSVPPDKLLLHYTGGPIQGTHFKEEVSPGTRTRFYGLLENFYFLPSTQRNYIISGDPNRGDRHGVDTIITPSKDRVSMSVEAAVYFK